MKGKKWQMKRQIKWNSILRIEEISPRKTKDWVYVILYTEAGVTVCCSESQANKLCLYEPYEMKGYINYLKGGNYLVLEKATLADGKNFRQVAKGQG